MVNLEDMPELCRHTSPSECKDECWAKAKAFEEWVRANTFRRPPASFETRVWLLWVVIGMAKDAGYDLDGFVRAVKVGWPHVSERSQSTRRANP